MPPRRSSQVVMSTNIGPTEEVISAAVRRVRDEMGAAISSEAVLQVITDKYISFKSVTLQQVKQAEGLVDGKGNLPTEQRQAPAVGAAGEEEEEDDSNDEDNDVKKNHLTISASERCIVSGKGIAETTAWQLTTFWIHA